MMLTFLLVTVSIFSFLALVSTGYTVYHLLVIEQSRMNDAETHAFTFYDEMMQSFLPRSLSSRLAHQLKVEQPTSAVSGDKAGLAKPL